MIGSALKRYLGEFQQYLRNRKYEVTESGIYFPAAKVGIAGFYTHWVAGYESEVMTDKNLIPDEGLNHMLNVVLKGPSGDGTQITSWYLALHSGSGTPTAALTAANYNSTLNEITSSSEGYTEATRVLWVGDAVDTVNTEVINDTSPATFTIATASSLNVNGAAMLSASAKGATSGTLISAGKFAATRVLSDSDEFKLKYKIDFDAV